MNNTNLTDITDLSDVELDTLLGYEPTVEEILEECKALRCETYARNPRLVWRS